MIVGKVDYPTYTGGGLSFGYDIGSDQFKGNALQTRYKSFSLFNLSSMLGYGLWKNGKGIYFGYGYGYTFFSKDKPDPNNANASVTVESFRKLNNQASISYSQDIYRQRRALFGISLRYIPYNESTFSRVASLPTRKFYAHGQGYSATLYMALIGLGCDVSYKYYNYKKKDLTESIGMFGCGFGFSLF